MINQKTMKNRITRNALVVLLAIIVAVAFTPMTAFADDSNEPATEVKSGDTKTITSTPENFKFKLTKPSKVVVTAEFITVGGSPEYDFFGTSIEADTTMWGYTDKSIAISESISGMEVVSSSTDDVNKWADIFVWKGAVTYYLNANKSNEFYYLMILPLKQNESSAEVTVTWTDIKSDGGDTKALAKNVDVVKGATVKHITQSCSDGNWFKFTIPSAADLTVTYSLKSIIPTNPGGYAGRLHIYDAKGSYIDIYDLQEKGTSTTSKTTKYKLPKAGTYYFHAAYNRTSLGTEHSVNIKANLLASQITLNKTKLTLKKGKTFSLKVKKWTPANVGSKTVTWKSSNPKVVKVNKKTGKIKALKKGNAKITAKTSNGKTATCKVTVKK